MNNETGQRLTEAIYALTNELRKQADKGPSHTGAAPFTSGDAVTVTNPRSEWEGMTGRVLEKLHDSTHVELSGGYTTWVQTSHLTKADNK